MWQRYVYGEHVYVVKRCTPRKYNNTPLTLPQFFLVLYREPFLRLCATITLRTKMHVCVFDVNVLLRIYGITRRLLGVYMFVFASPFLHILIRGLVRM